MTGIESIVISSYHISDHEMRFTARMTGIDGTETVKDYIAICRETVVEDLPVVERWFLATLPRDTREYRNVNAIGAAYYSNVADIVKDLYVYSHRYLHYFGDGEEAEEEDQ